MKSRNYRILTGLLSVSIVMNSMLALSLPAWAQKPLPRSENAAGTENVTGEENMAGEQNLSPQLSAPSAILMEASTGQIIYEKDSQVRRSPASITKIMTLLLIFEQLKAGKLHLEDEVSTSAHAKSMGGSQVFLEEGEIQTVDTLIKCIAVASGNDASVAMAEHIAGSESAFVEMMNQKAKELGMVDTRFEDCCGLTASDGHYTTAKDVALMSKALITEHPQVYAYTKIWMEDITHTTRKGSSQFTLSSTNKLLKQYPYTTGLKTGSTDKAKYCFAATANKDGIDLIAVVMAAPDFRVRFQDAARLLDYGFSVSSLYRDENKDTLPDRAVTKGVAETVPIAYESEFCYLDVKGNDVKQIIKEIKLPEAVEAPVNAGDIAGRAIYLQNGRKVGSVNILFMDSVEKAGYRDYVKKVFAKFF